MKPESNDVGGWEEVPPEKLRLIANEYKRKLTPEDLKWYENPTDLVPFSEIVAEIEEFVRIEKLRGTVE